MAKPNSLTTMLRQILVKYLDPQPAMNEAWCITCSLNDGQTKVLPINYLEPHLLLHPKGDYVLVKSIRNR